MNSAKPHDAPPAPFKPTSSSFYDAAVAKAFFESSGRPEKITAGTTLFVENAKSIKKGIFSKPVIHRMYLLTDGSVELSAGGKVIDTVHAGEVFGEMAVISEIHGVATPSAVPRSMVCWASCRQPP